MRHEAETIVDESLEDSLGMRRRWREEPEGAPWGGKQGSGGAKEEKEKMVSGGDRHKDPLLLQDH